jgi:colicin import membrane protein
MPRALKTYITNLGFFELAIAAPSMKAALEAWGMSHNAFAHGFARETDDPRIIAAATAQPGTVLKRAVGSKDEFRTDARLPTSLPNIRPPRIEAPKAKKRAPARPKPDKKAVRADIISFEKARARREKERAAAEAKAEKQRAAKQRATDAAEAAMEKARARHEAALDAIAAEQEKLERRAQSENKRWEAERRRLQAALDKADG